VTTNKNKVISTDDIGKELAAQLSTVTPKVLPPADTTQTDGYLYMVFLPADVSMQDTDPVTKVVTKSCVDFCGDHWWANSPSAGHSIIYAALPDIKSCPGTNCYNNNPDWIQASTQAMSHELVEALTDPKNAGWRAQLQPSTCGEIGDL